MATYQESNSGTLPFYNTQLENLINQGGGLATGQLNNPPPQQYVAGFSPLQQQAQNLTQQNVGNYQPLLNQSQQYANNAVGAAQYNPNQLQQFLNPYLSGVVGEIGRLGNENFANSVAPTIASNFTGLGQYGSARQGMALSDAAARNQREILGQQAQALNTGYNNAANQYQNWAQMGVGANQNAASQFGNLAQVQQQLGLGDVGALSTAGLSQQQLAQKQADLPFLNWQTQQQFPWQQLNNWANLFKAGTPQQSSTWNASFKKGGLARYADGGDVTQDDIPMQLADASIPKTSTPSMQSSLLDEIIRPAFKERMSMLDALRNARELQPLERDPLTMRLGEAMMRAGAQGPANFGQLIGRSGTSYFDTQNALDAEDKDRMLKRMALEDKIAPDITNLSSFAKTMGMNGNKPTVKMDKDGNMVVYNPQTGGADIVHSSQRGEYQRLYRIFFEKAVAEQSPNPEAYAHANASAVLTNGPKAGLPLGGSGLGTPATGFPSQTSTSVSQTSIAQQPESITYKDKVEEERQKNVQAKREEVAADQYKTRILPAEQSARRIEQAAIDLSNIKTVNDMAAPVREQIGAVIGVFDPTSNWAEESARLKSKRPILAALANAILQNAKGTQTEGDAQRAYNEFAKITDPDSAQQYILSMAREQAKRAQAEAQFTREFAKYPQDKGEKEGSLSNFEGHWKDTDYGKAKALVANVAGKDKSPRYVGYSEWRNKFMDANPHATLSDAVKQWNKLTGVSE